VSVLFGTLINMCINGFVSVTCRRLKSVFKEAKCCTVTGTEAMA